MPALTPPRPGGAAPSSIRSIPAASADSNGDGVGDLAGITAKLDYVASLGVDAIWLSPFFASPMKDFGYDVSDYRAVDPDFRHPGGFRPAGGACPCAGPEGDHRPGLCPHLRRPCLVSGKPRRPRPIDKADWYVWADPKPDGTPPNNWLSVFYGPCWTWDGRRGQYYMHNFLPSQPNLNVNNPGRAGGAVRHGALLAGAGRGWLSAGCHQFRHARSRR